MSLEIWQHSFIICLYFLDRINGTFLYILNNLAIYYNLSQAPPVMGNYVLGIKFKVLTPGYRF